jgi:hypothetical protein
VSYKTAFVLTLTFVVQILILCGDILGLQMVHSHLDAIGQTTSFRIAQTGRIDAAIEDWLLEQDIRLTCLSNCTPRFGDTLEFRLDKSYDPLIIAADTLTLSVVRSAVIGYYN